MLIINAHILPMDGTSIENGYIYIKNGKISAVGNMDDIPDTLNNSGNKFDAKGALALPGFVDAHSHIGMWEDGLAFEGDDGNENTDPSTPNMRAVDAINPMDFAFTEALDGGVTTVVTGPGSSNPVAGQFAAIKTYGRRIEDMLIKAPLCMKFALGENPKISFTEKGNAPKTRMATAAIIRETLSKAVEYAEGKRKKNKDDRPEYDAKSEAILPLLEGKIFAQFHAHRADDIFTAIRIAKEFKIKYVITHCTEGHLIADILAKEGARAIVGPSLATRSKPELKNQSFETPAVLSKAGVTTAITVDHPVLPQQFLPLAAALAVKAGMEKEEALRAITINAAVISGIDERVGSITVGKDADIVVFDRDPLDIMAKTIFITVNGKRVK
ncbi:MAG: amidohydrolase [Bacillota bacterium]|nr:amidohydrolase [Bacillota bacterium]